MSDLPSSSLWFRAVVNILIHRRRRFHFGRRWFDFAQQASFATTRGVTEQEVDFVHHELFLFLVSEQW